MKYFYTYIVASYIAMYFMLRADGPMNEALNMARGFFWLLSPVVAPLEALIKFAGLIGNFIFP